MSIYLGIDPGFTGAIVGVDMTNLRIAYHFLMPTGTETLANGKERKVLDVVGVRDAIRHRQVERTYIEMVGTRPKESPVAAFRFGEGFGILKGVLAGFAMPFWEIRPTHWKIEAGVAKMDKDAVLPVAKDLFPRDADLFSPKKRVRTKADCIAIADAALIAYFGADVAKRRNAA